MDTLGNFTKPRSQKRSISACSRFLGSAPHLGFVIPGGYGMVGARQPDYIGTFS